MFTFPVGLLSNSAYNGDYTASFSCIFYYFLSSDYLWGDTPVTQLFTWLNDKSFVPPSTFSESYTYNYNFTVTPDLADIDIGGDIYVDTGDRILVRQYDYVYSDTDEPYWTIQPTFYINARWEYMGTDHFDYDLPRSDSLNLKIIPLLIVSSSDKVGLSNLPAYIYTVDTFGSALIGSESKTLNWQNIDGITPSFADGSTRYISLIADSYVIASAELVSTATPIQTYPLYWRWKRTANYYDL